MSNDLDLPTDAPKNLTDDSFVIRVEMLDDDTGTTFLETEAATRARYNQWMSDLEIKSESADDTAKLRLQGAAAMHHELKLTANVRKTHKDAIKTYEFVFRRATTRDVRQAEEVAALEAPPEGVKPDDIIPLRIRPEFCNALADKTLIKTDYPGHESFDTLRMDVSEYVAQRVAQRVRFSASVSRFFATWENCSSTVSISRPT